MAEEDLTLDPRWTRIEILLPVNTISEMQAANEIISLLYKNYEGVTFSVMRPHVYQGYYYDADSKVLYIDRNTLVFVDVEEPIGEADEVDPDRETAGAVF